MISRFFTYAAGPLLVAYLILLLGSSYFSQQHLRQAAHNNLLFDLEKQASALSYFYSERKHDISTLSKDNRVTVFFSNRAQGMSTNYGLQNSFLSMEEAFQQITNSRTLNHTPIYLRVLFTDNNGNPLIDTGLNSGKNIQWLQKTLQNKSHITPLVIQNGNRTHAVIVLPYLYKGQKMGNIVAEINYDKVMHYLIHPQRSKNTEYAILFKDMGFLLNHKQLPKQLAAKSTLGNKALAQLPIKKFVSFEKNAVPGTPFILAARYAPAKTIGTVLTSRWYIVSLVILTLLVLYSFMVRTRSQTQTLLLETQIKEAYRQSTLLNKQNALLEKEVRKRLDSEANLQTLIETIPDLIWLKDPNGVYLHCNHKFKRVYGVSEKDIIGKTDYDLVNKELADFLRKHDAAALAADSPLIHEDKITYADDGHKEIVETIKTPLRDSQGRLVGILGIARDITARKMAEREFRYFSIHDPLTGLYNRRVLEEHIQAEIHRAERYGHNLSVFMVDLDHFKKVNDTYGHPNGDLALCHLATIMEQSIRTTDYIARYGGEEFVVILPETEIVKARELAERLRKTIENYNIPIPGIAPICLTASIGVSCFPEHGDSWQALLSSADSAMYLAKWTGRNQVKTPQDQT